MGRTFQVVFTLAGEDSLEPHLDALHAAGCDDAAFMGPAMDGTFIAQFDRDMADFAEAVDSAVIALRTALPPGSVIGGRLRQVREHPVRRFKTP